ncbi:hypothetical protein [Acidocella sp.]|uniref:hypothetical protein n=1 Tax=Acidocella sp. TaxID=50710 RepID=UPI00262DA96F|nr:hypothetical protein [Acidocella sp.]
MEKIMLKIRSFFESPQNRTGLSIWAATALTALVQQVVAHQPLAAADVFGIILGFLKIIEPENTVTLAQMKTVETDIKKLIKVGDLGSFADVARDAAGLIGSLDK